MKKLCFLLANMLATLSISAQSFDAAWELPVPTEFTQWQPETPLYLYNVGAGGFYIAYQGGGPDEAPYWRTRSSVNDSIGAEVRFTRENPDPTFDEDWSYAGDNTYLMVNWVPKFSEFRCTFSEGHYNSVWTDNNRGYDHAWNIIQNEDGSICIEGCDDMKMSDYEYQGKYMGVLASDPDRVLYLNDREEIGEDAIFHDRWKVMTPEAYETYIVAAKEQIRRVAAARQLRRVIEEALEKYPTLNVSAFVAVYNNTQSTLEELKDAAVGVEKAVVEEVAGGASPSNPRDLTELIKNPHFTGRNYDGWLGTRFGAGGDVDDVAEHFNKNFDTYQEIPNLPAGVYSVRVKGFYRAGNSPQTDYTAMRSGQASNAQLYVSGATLGEFSTPIKHLTEMALEEGMGLADGAMKTEIEFVTEDGSIWLPNTMVGANAYFHNEDHPELYYSEITGAISQGDVLRFGVKKNVTIGDDWAIFDDFQLLYYGDGKEAYRLIVDNMLATNEVNLSGEGVFYGQPEVDAYQDARKKLEASEDIVSIQENLPLLKGSRESLSKSVDAYAGYIAAIDDVKAWLEEAESQGVTGDDYELLLAYALDGETKGDFPNGNLRYIIPTYEDGNGAGSLSSEEIAKETEYVKTLKQQAIRTSLHDGSTLTDLLSNPSFDMGGAAGWLTDPQYNNGAITNWRGGVAPNYCAEAFNHNFDVYQEISGLSNGLYEVSVQAFYRTSDNAAAFNAWKYQTGDEKVLTEVYLNEFSAPVKNVMDIQFANNLANNCYMNGDALYTLDGMASASTAFALEDETQNFTQRVYGLVTDGKLRLGIRNTNGKLNARWTLFDNFQLVYRAKNVDALTSVIENYAERADLVMFELLGQNEKDALSKALNEAQSATTSETLYDALIRLVEAYNEANASVECYERLDNALNLFNEALMDAALNNPSCPAYNDAADYYDLVSNDFGNQEMSNAEVEKALEEIDMWIAMLRVPDPNGASDETPVDMSSTIVNATFDIVNDFTGWQGTAFGTGGDAGQNGEHYMKNFDSYQTILGLPAGTYMLSVKGMYRHGSPKNDFIVFREAQAAGADYADPTLLAFLYAETPSSKVSAPIKHTCDGAKTAPDFTNYNAGTDEDPCYVADSRTSTDLYFHDEEAPEAYLTTVTFKLQQGEPLRIGVKKDGEVLDQSWAIFDDFALTYFGADSKKEESGDAVNVADILMTGNTSVYSLDGRKMNRLGKGVNIIRMPGGARKVLVK